MKYLLAAMALQDPARFLDEFGGAGGARLLTDLWTAVGDARRPDQRAAADGIAVEDRRERCGVLTLVLPPPEDRGEPWFLGLVEGPNRVFCLERASPPGPPTQLAELAATGRANWGRSPAPEVDAFCDAVRAIVDDPQAQPLLVVPLRLV